ncbi:hypothetical protein ASPZODRAFT_74056 [Penicilliopsis zonata CBS 506.65]|uniref:Fatty acid hydroxylase domain-containing protein n=1 Tax=Penicilliopsis zonata CBS 506.65 TaxID=1073090 RepID=A0A1L9S8Y9_9EURO|nr:hypothetical protein ASPZODRAFT_74056 [Penicilliopsis zonata CBS 506.65]OJJ43627.1 hypothetical protein ASPZODRAFT_74056 [Penicilliopsis zonata CBS 506.65]
MENPTYSGLTAFATQHFPELSNLERLWWAHYAYWNSDIIATGLITFLSHEIVYFTRCFPWIIADSLPSIFRKYKIQDQKMPTAADQWACTKYILLIHFVVELPLIVFFHPMMEFCGVHFDIPFPTIRAMIPQIIIFFLVEDTYHYWIHRLMHWGPLYRSIHRIHHQYATPFGLAAEYASPWETLVLGFGTIGPPLVLGYFTDNVHLLTVIIWVTLRQFQAIDSHSGYDFPWSMRHWMPFWGGADWHDDHHRYFWGNYSSSFRWWDIMMGTVSGPDARKKRRAAREAKLAAQTKTE